LAIAVSKSKTTTQQAPHPTQTAATAKPKAPAKPVAAKPVSPAAVVSIGKSTAKTPGYSASTVNAGAPASPGFTAGAGEVVVDIQNSDSGYENKIYWSADNWKTRNYLGVDNQTASINLGTFKSGTKIEFGIDNGNGDFFKTGAAGLNSDGFQHARVQSDSAGTQIGFEDLRGGGDQDFNDAIVRVRSLPDKPQSPVVQNPSPVVKQPEKPGSTGSKPPAKDNRSGLGDGTNPGQGDGRVNSPNVGTDNPNEAGSVNSKVKASDLIAAVLQPTAVKPPSKVVAATKLNKATQKL
jgi:Domain of unknown function (DUF4114)